MLTKPLEVLEHKTREYPSILYLYFSKQIRRVLFNKFSLTKKYQFSNKLDENLLWY